MRYSWFDSTTDYEYLGGEIGRRARLKILLSVMIVTVRFCSGVQCNDLEISDGTDAMYEMETFETYIKMWIRYKPYRHYITLVP